MPETALVPVASAADQILAKRTTGELRQVLGVDGERNFAIPAGWAMVAIPRNPAAPPRPFANIIFTDGLVPREIAEQLQLAIHLGDDTKKPGAIRTGKGGLTFAPITIPEELVAAGRWMIWSARVGTLFPLDVLVPESRFDGFIEFVRRHSLASAAADPKALPS